MKIAGLQKLTLLDYPNKLACTIFLNGCNFKCGYCHNPELVINSGKNKFLDEKEILLFLKERKKYLEGVCITGGEASINIELPNFLKKIKVLGYKIKLDTNGSNPKLLREIIDKELIDYIAIDIKYNKEDYERVTGVEVNMDNVEKSIKIISNSRLDYEFRTTAIPGYHDSRKMKEMSSWVRKIAGRRIKRYAIQNFVARENGLLDRRFERIRSFSEEELNDLKKSISDEFEEVIIRN